MVYFRHLSVFLSLFQDYEYLNHPQSTQHQKNDRCPPPPQMLPERACEVPGCRSDSECERHKRCCYNGCIYACLESVQPPPGQQNQQTGIKIGLQIILKWLLVGNILMFTEMQEVIFFLVLLLSIAVAKDVCVLSSSGLAGAAQASMVGG